MAQKQSQRIGRRKQVALIIESSNEYARKIIHGIQNFTRENMQWSITYREHQRGNPDLTWLDNWNGDGILARIENERIAEIVQKRRLPAVDLSSFRLLRDIPCVETDDKEYAHLAAKHLISRNFRHFAFCGDSRYNWSKLRERYFIQYIEQQGFRCHTFDSNKRELHISRIRQEMTTWVQNLPKPVGIMACFDIQGQELLEACRMANISVPFSVAVLGCDNDELICELAEPSMSSIIPNAAQTGYYAAFLLERMMNGEKIDQMEYLFGPVGIQTRQSTDVFATHDKLIVTALDYIYKNACSGVKVQDLLDHAYMSRRSFEARFKKCVGKTPHEVILDVKIKYAKQLLEETDLPVDEVANRTGFGYTEYFCVAFRRETSMLPREYRRLNAKRNS